MDRRLLLLVIASTLAVPPLTTACMGCDLVGDCREKVGKSATSPGEICGTSPTGPGSDGYVRWMVQDDSWFSNGGGVCSCLALANDRLSSCGVRYD